MDLTLPAPPPMPVLPQDAKNPEERNARVAAIAAKYPLALTSLPSGAPPADQAPEQTPILRSMPATEHFSDRYEFERGAATLPRVRNDEVLKKAGGTGNPLSFLDHFETLGGFEQLYVALPAPESTAFWMSDEAFAEQRLSGYNPGMIVRVTSRDQLPCGVDQDALDVAVGKDRVDAALAGAGLFVVDYTETLDAIGGGTINIPVPGVPPVRKFLPKPAAFFSWELRERNDPQHDSKTGYLAPLAIQIDGKDGPVVVTPAEGEGRWLYAKACFSVADTNVHEMVRHLGRCHFALEAFGAITPRTLAPEHPVHILLEPHLRFVVWNNEQGVLRLVNVDGPVSLLMAPTLKDSVHLALRAAKEWSMKRTFPEDLRERGFETCSGLAFETTADETLPHYPYRDDGLLIWNELERYVDEYLRLYYRDDQSVSDDTEIQAWASALASTGDEGAGHVRDMPASIETIDALRDVLVMIVFSSAAEHSAVNYPQYPLMGFIPNAPAAGYADYQAFFADESLDDAQQAEALLRFLPPKFTTVTQITLTTSLGLYRFDALGDYQSQLADPRARDVVYRFHQRLREVERRIDKRNEARFRPYEFLKPSLVLNSASI